MNMFNLSNTFAIITGAAQGNGKAIASGYEKAGANVLAVDTKVLKFNNIVQGDISDGSTIDEIKSLVGNYFYDNLVLINNAGISKPAPFPYPKKDWDLTLKVNLTAPFMLIEALIPIFKKTKKGSIINITSLNAELAFPNNPAYVASKGGLKQLTKSFALDLGPRGIRVNNVGPGYIKTKMTKGSWENLEQRSHIASKTVFGRWGTPDDLIGIVCFLLSDLSAYITGQDIYVDGGWSVKGL